jgi:murein DD-endopeptidase MepM/ murein hydrolase activator NlpD
VLSDALSQNMDVRAVFSSVGKAFSGESELAETADEVYRAVFAPDESAAEEVWVRVSGMEDRQVFEFLKNKGIEREHPTAESAVETEQTETDTLSYILYSNRTLPENVNMEQVLLGFDYVPPVSGTLSSGFGYREHPTEGEERFHYGVDLVADSGTDICSFADGTVTVVGESNSYGNYCVVVHENGCSTLYAHCSRITVSSGKMVSKGETIAEVGESGTATGPHLHFELQQDGVYLNPIYYVAER